MTRLVRWFAANPIAAVNCVFFGFDRAAIHAQPFSGIRDQYFDAINCAFISCQNAIGWDDADSATAIVWRIVNCYGVLNTRDYDFTAASSSTPTTTGSTSNPEERTE